MGHFIVWHIPELDILLKFYLFLRICLFVVQPIRAGDIHSHQLHFDFIQNFIVDFKYRFSIFPLVLCVHLQVIKVLSSLPWTQISISYQCRSLLVSRALSQTFFPFCAWKAFIADSTFPDPAHSAFHPPIHDLIHFSHSLSLRAVFLYPIWLSCYYWFLKKIFTPLYSCWPFFSFSACLLLDGTPTSGYRIIYPLYLLPSLLEFTQCYLYFSLILCCCVLTCYYYSYQQAVIYRVLK